jgi:hypothetical protein
MVNTKPKKHDSNFTMRVDTSFTAKLDDLRAETRPVKTRADMLRQLVEDAWQRMKKGPRSAR